MPGGHVAAREVVEHFGAVAVVAVDDHDRVALVHQYRRPVGRHLWELPAGLLDVPGEPAEVCAARELAEEAGLRAARWEVLTDMVTSPGVMDEAVRVFLARELTPVDRGEADDEEADLELHWVPLDEAVEWVAAGRVANGIAIAGLLLAARACAGGATRSVEEPFALRPTALAARKAAAASGTVRRG
ncbi:ADP-ribose pyrophosphatase [Corynebacterium sp. 13CS0277]|nr:ADP-ribose pyrophosphatase [Corynebacterium sp. 13CS0277]